MATTSSRSPLVSKLVRYVLIFVGATLVISAVTNITAAWQLIESAEEQSLGVTRNEIVGWFSVLLAMGLGLIVIGLRPKK